MRVKEIVKKAVTITGDKTLKEAAKLMADQGIGCLVVTANGDLVGLVTERDVLKKVSKDVDSLNKPVRDVMSTKIITVEPRTHIDDAAKIMSKHKIKKLPVLDDGKLLGIITSTDLVSNSADFGGCYLFD
ncbi:CBS domain-containing protein [Candidatus Woesearchaeota archaeon]|jgi:CBS domain-containing protein|nr:CBS domain-containing protein [Candidatus Woesearchaeota archaeon]